MNASLLAIRSVAVEFARRLYTPILIGVVAGVIALLWLSLWLTTLSDWWWIFAILIIGMSFFAAICLTITGVIIRLISPARTKDQKRQARQLVDKIQRLAEVTATPKFFLFFSMMRDVVWPREEGFIASVSGDASTLKDDFARLRDSFRRP